MRLNRFYPLLSIFLFSFLLIGCNSEPPLRAIKVAKADVTTTVASVNSGTVRAEQLAELAFGTVGRVMKLNVDLGDTVKKGDIIAEIENSDLQAGLYTAQREFDRREELRKAKLISQAEVDDASKFLDMAKAHYDKSLIVAPYDGLIAELNLEVGQLSQITAVVPKPLVRIVDLNPRYVRAEIDEVDLAKVHVGSKASVKILAVRREPYTATVRKVVHFISSIREQDRTAEIELVLDGVEGLLPVGASADVEVLVEKKEGVLAVPSRSVLGRRDEKYVFKLGSGKAIKTPVKLGAFNYDRTEIESGLNIDEVVILPGESSALTDGQKVNYQIEPWP